MEVKLLSKFPRWLGGRQEDAACPLSSTKLSPQKSQTRLHFGLAFLSIPDPLTICALY
jgi:hypothetical protein